MIDSELDWLNDRRRTPKKDKIFREERETFHERFKMLPDCFYIPPEREPWKPNDKEVDVMDKVALRLKGAEGYMLDYFYEVEGYKPYYNGRKYPFRKFKAPLAAVFVDSLWTVMNDIKDTHELDAFRISARKIIINERREGATDFLHYMLHHADKQEPNKNKWVRLES
eukprot:scaffold82347_cov46-Attheya_sp.AAC.2